VQHLYRGINDEVGSTGLDWLALESDTLRATVHGLPGPSDISLPVDVNVVVEFLSR
jgi:small subunit ribosomal protein S4